MTKQKKIISVISIAVFVVVGVLAGVLTYVFTRNSGFDRIATPTGLSGFTKKARQAVTADYYVASDGSDSNEGSIDNPFLTITKAQETIRHRIASKSVPNGGLKVAIKGGNYNVNNIVFDERDSSTKDKPITYTAYDENEVALNGGVKLSNQDFKAVEGEDKSRLSADAQNKVVYIDLNDYGVTAEDYGKLYALGAFNTADKYDGDTVGPSACELFYNNERMSLARYPNDTNLKTGKVSDIGDCYEPKTGTYREEWLNTRNPRGGTFKMDNKTAKRVKNWKSYEDVWAFGYFFWDWADMSTPISSISNDGSLTTKYCSKYGFKKNAPYYFYNVYEELDTDGEWYLDRATGRLYIYQSDDMASANIQLSLTTDSIIEVNGVENIIFDGLTVGGSRENAITINSNNVTVTDCKAQNTADNGIVIKGNNNIVTRSEVLRTGKNGIVVDGGNRDTLTRGDNLIDNNNIHDYAELQRTYASGIRLSGVGNTASHNEIFNAPHMAVFYEGNDHVVEYNNIHDVVLFSSDAGAIYSGRNLSYYGNVIRYNCIYDIGSGEFKPAGIYFDDALAGQTAYSNVLVNIPSQGVLIGGGRDIEVYNNLIINAGMPLAYDDRAYDGYHNDGWYKSKVNKPDASFWVLLEEAKAFNDKWGHKYPGIDQMHADYTRTKDKDFAVVPNGKVFNNITLNKKGIIGEFGKAISAYGTIKDNYAYKITDIGFKDFSGGNYSLTKAFMDANKDITDIPYAQIGQY